jgi:hypothetical protein
MLRIVEGHRFLEHVDQEKAGQNGCIHEKYHSFSGILKPRFYQEH